MEFSRDSMPILKILSKTKFNIVLRQFPDFLFYPVCLSFVLCEVSHEICTWLFYIRGNWWSGRSFIRISRSRHDVDFGGAVTAPALRSTNRTSNTISY